MTWLIHARSKNATSRRCRVPSALSERQRHGNHTPTKQKCRPISRACRQLKATRVIFSVLPAAVIYCCIIVLCTQLLCCIIQPSKAVVVVVVCFIFFP